MVIGNIHGTKGMIFVAQQQKEIKYILCSEDGQGNGYIHREAICHIAYATALDILDVASFVGNDQIRKLTSKKTKLSYSPEGIDLTINIPIKKGTDIYTLIEKAQEEIKEKFLDFLSIHVRKVNLIVDQVLF